MSLSITKEIKTKTRKNVNTRQEARNNENYYDLILKIQI